MISLAALLIAAALSAFQNGNAKAVITYARVSAASTEDYSDFLATQLRIIESHLFRKRVADATGKIADVKTSTTYDAEGPTITVSARGDSAHDYLVHLMRQYLLFRSESPPNPVVVTYRRWIEGKSTGQPVQLETGGTSLVERTEVVNQAFTSTIAGITINGRQIELPNNGVVLTGDPLRGSPAAHP